MARGFESKDVEFQQAEAERTRTRPAPRTPAEQERLVKRQALELSLARMQDDLGRTRVPAHREMVERAIATLRAELAALDATGQTRPR